MAFHISLTDNRSDIVREYAEGIRLSGPYEVGLKSFVTYNTVPNISPENRNNRFQMINEKTREGCVVDIPTGVYELDDLFQLIREDPGVKAAEPRMRLELNKNTLRTVLYTEEWTIDFPPGNKGSTVGTVFGFSPGTYPPKIAHSSNMLVDIFSINAIKIKCNLVSGNYDNLKHNDNTLYKFPLNSEIGEKIIERPNTLSYYMVNTDTIYTLVVRIVDQDDKSVDFRGERINITLEFRPVAQR